MCRIEGVIRRLLLEPFRNPRPFSLSSHARGRAVSEVLMRDLHDDVRVVGAAYVDLARLPLESVTPQRIAELQAIISGGSWADLDRFWGGQQESDLLIIRLLRDASGKLMCLFWVSPLDPWMPDRIDRAIEVDKLTFERNRAAIKRPWFVLGAEEPVNAKDNNAVSRDCKTD